MSELPSVNDCPECRSWKRDAKGISVFRHLGPVPPNMSKPNHHIEKRTLKKKRTDITSRAGALMDLIVPRSAGCSGCAVWRKPRPNISRC
jgi:hypothetical protein